MKHARNTFRHALTVALLFLSWSIPSFAGISNGFDNGNAGDAFSAEFLYSGRDVLQRLEILAANGRTLIDTRKLRAAMETTVIVSEERVYLDGLERDAVNYPSQKLIKVSRARWRDVRPSSETRARLTLVLHEFLWVAGFDDTNFQISIPVVEALNVPPYSAGIWLNVPGLAFSAVECSGLAEDGTLITVLVGTKGATKAPDRGEVRIQRNGNVFGYRFQADEIAQFFEFDDVDRNWATVGLSAFVGREFPVTLKYDGPNYVDQDLRTALEIEAHKPGGLTSDRGNFLQIWKGPGFDVDEFHRLRDPICSVSSNN